MALQLASVFDFSIEEKAEERADRRDRRKTPQFVPSWLKRSVDDVRRHLKREPGHEPTRYREYLAGIELLPSAQNGNLTIAYHSACSLQHGQKITALPKELLSKNGFVVKDVPESHLCCGSAGTYNILQPDIASRLRDRKVANIATVKPDMIAAGNIGCMIQIASGTSVPVVHTIELLDWATGGSRPGLN